MPLTPETLPRHELNGLQVRVADAPNPDLVGIEGRVVVETANTLHLEDHQQGASRVRQVPKQGSTFEFALYERAGGHATDEAADHRRAKLDELPDDVREPEKGSGIASELDETAAATPDDRPDADDAAGVGGRETDAAGPSGEGVTYVTVDGARLLSRPAERTETRGDSPWQSD